MSSQVKVLSEGVDKSVEPMNEVRSRMPLTGNQMFRIVPQEKSPATVKMQIPEHQHKAAEGQMTSKRKRADDNKPFLQSSDS